MVSCLPLQILDAIANDRRQYCVVSMMCRHITKRNTTEGTHAVAHGNGDDKHQLLHGVDVFATSSRADTSFAVSRYSGVGNRSAWAGGAPRRCRALLANLLSCASTVEDGCLSALAVSHALKPATEQPRVSACQRVLVGAQCSDGVGAATGPSMACHCHWAPSAGVWLTDPAS